MGLKSVIVRPFAGRVHKRIQHWSKNAVRCQENILKEILDKAKSTAFGKDHNFSSLESHADYTQAVPLRDYEDIKGYIERIKNGEKDILWPGKPRYFAKTSGTTSGVKYIPITSASIPNHINTARNALFNYFIETRNGSFFDGKMIFLSGSPELEEVGGVPTGRLSGIVNHLLPAWVKGNQLPDFQTNCIEDWEIKLDKIVELTAQADLRLISGIPPWVQMYYEKLLDYTGKSTVKEVFPNLSLFVFGGVTFSPYKAKLEALVGEEIDSLETYPASEGFIAYQDDWDEDSGMLLNCNSGIFFEFIPVNSLGSENPPRLSLGEVELGVNYLLVLSSNAGLWAYDIGDTVEFTSLKPPRLKVTGRVRHFISAFGEHVIAKEVELALKAANEQLGGEITEFTVAPQVSPSEGGLPYHEWFIAFSKMPDDLAAFGKMLDEEMIKQNIYYRDLIESKILKPLVIRPLPEGAFQDYMKSRGKLGGQNKVPRLSNSREIADALLQLNKTHD